MKTKIKLNIFSLIAILYILFIIFNDYMCLIFRTNASVLLYVASFVLVGILFLLLRKKIKIEYKVFDKIDIVFFIIIIIVFLTRLAIPDSAFDTLNYHIYNQERTFSDNATFNFFPARWINTFSLPLADRMHYFFRIILGYRLGIITNLLFMIVIYYQLKIILSKFIKNKYYVALISIVILLTEQLLSNMITYYVDILSIPIFLEIIINILENKESNNYNNCFILLLSGIIFSLKVSNAFLLIPLILICIVRYRKSINYKTFLIGIPIFILPFLPYFINNFIQTGNPVFPFYNSIFESNYLPNTNWTETFYGPKTFLERLFWPICIFFDPRRAFDTNIYYGRIGYGYIVSLFVLIYSIYNRFIKHRKNDIFIYSCYLYIILCLIWSNFMMGYIRYALILEVLSGIVIAIAIHKFFNSKKVIPFIVCIFCIYSFVKVSFMSMGDMLVTNTEISWRYSYYENKTNYKNNLNYIFSNKWDYTNYTKNIDCFGIVDYNSAYATLLDSNKRVISLNAGYTNDYGKEQFDKVVNKCENIYVISTSITLDRTEEYLEKTNFKRKGSDISLKADFLNYDYDLILFEVEKD